MIKKCIHLSDVNNDWYLDANNHIALTYDNQKITKEIVQSKYSTILGEVFSDDTIGMDWFGIMFNEYRTHQERVDEIERVGKSAYGVYDIQNITYEEDNKSGVGKFALELLTTYGTIPISL